MRHFVAIGEFKLELQSGNAQFGSNSTIFRAVWPSNVTYDLEKKIGHLFYDSSSLVHHFFHSHWWIQTGVTVRKRPIGVKIDDFVSRVTLQFGVWPWQTISHHFYTTSSFVHHFIANGEFKLKSQSRNAQFGSISTIFRAVWPSNLTYDLDNRAPLLWYLKLCASFHSHWWIKTGVTVRKHPIWVIIYDLVSRETL